MKVAENNQSIFRAYDIRGRYPDEVNEKMVLKIVRALAGYFKPGLLIVGHDARLSSPSLYRAVLEGLNSRPRVVAVGLTTTPMMYFLVTHLKASGGIAVTASHNPKQFNGLKVVGRNADPLSGIEVAKVLKGFKGDKKPTQSYRPEQKKYYKDYARFLKKTVPIKHRIKIVFDCSNGAAALVLRETLRGNRSISYKIINGEPDGRFPNHSPDPLTPGALSQLKKKVVAEAADLGVIFDADGDRAFFIDEKGESIDSDYVVYLLTKNFRAPYLIDVAEGRTPLLWISKKLDIIESIVGHYFIKKEFRKRRIDFAAEHSGHYYFKKFGYNDSGILAALFVIKQVAGLKRQGNTLSGWLNRLPKHYASPEQKLHLHNFQKIARRIERHYQRKAERISHKDGLTVDFGDFWFNIRPSNTESVVRLNIEAKSKKKLNEVLTTLNREIKVE